MTRAYRAAGRTRRTHAGAAARSEGASCREAAARRAASRRAAEQLSRARVGLLGGRRARARRARNRADTDDAGAKRQGGGLMRMLVRDRSYRVHSTVPTEHRALIAGDNLLTNYLLLTASIPSLEANVRVLPPGARGAHGLGHGGAAAETGSRSSCCGGREAVAVEAEAVTVEASGSRAVGSRAGSDSKAAILQGNLPEHGRLVQSVDSEMPRFTRYSPESLPE